MDNTTKFINYLIYLIFMFGFIQIQWINGDDTSSGFSTAPQTNINNTDHLKYPYCYRFSWLGPKYNNESNDYKNATCDDVLHGAKGVPCILPLVVTENMNPPDTSLMWDTFKTSPNFVACRLVRGEVCARFEYTYNGAVENITYMCTKVSIEGEGPAPAGCYKQKENSTGREIEVCVCESRNGEYPCNLAEKIFTANFFIFILINLFILFNCNIIKFL